MLEIKYRKTNELKPYGKNARTHSEAQIKQIIASIEEYGFTNPILIDENDIIIAGHGRVIASKKMGLEEVPTITLRGLTDTQKRAYVIADNKMALNAGWDEKMLLEELKDILDDGFDLKLTGFDGDELEQLLKEDMELEAKEDDFEPIPPIEPKAKLGDIYQLGMHRLMCGDSTKEEDVAKLMDNNLADLVVTDPPYNVNVKNSKGMRIENDNLDDTSFGEFLTKAFKCLANSLKDGGGYYVWYASKTHVPFELALRDNGLVPKQQLVWDKGSFILGRSDYQWKHELCFYGWKEGQPHYFVDDRTQSTVFEDNEIKLNKLSKDEMRKLLEELLSDKVNTTVIHEKKPTVNDLHPTMKPIKLIARIIKNSSKQGELVLDLFGGSGSTLIACEQLNRKCHMMEFDPRYVDVIIERWEKLTNKKAIKLN